MTEGRHKRMLQNECFTRHLETHNSTYGPLFLAVGLHKPHIPHKFPEEFLKFHPYEVIRMINDSR